MDGARKCEEVLRLHMPHLFRKDRDVLHQLTLVLSPYILTHAGWFYDRGGGGVTWGSMIWGVIARGFDMRGFDMEGECRCSV